MWQVRIPHTRFSCTNHFNINLGYNCPIGCRLCTNKADGKRCTLSAVQEAANLLPNVLDDSVLYLTGGELYQDDIDYCTLYAPLLKLSYPKATITSLLFHKIQPFAEYVKANDFELWTSYAVSGRFSKDTWMLWLRNLSYLQAVGISPIVNILCTPSVFNPMVHQKMIHDCKRYFPKLRTFLSPLDKAHSFSAIEYVLSTEPPPNCLNTIGDSAVHIFEYEVTDVVATRNFWYKAAVAQYVRRSIV